jgi:poly(hydroxyalkanoate) depolymerase family esterase
MKRLSILISFLTLISSSFAGSFERVSNFGSNPGSLNMYKFTPSSASSKAPMVIVMHGCMQTAETFAKETGWEMMAEKYGFYLLLPEQNRSNNGMGCFTWFEKSDVTRGNGEIASIKAMMDNMKSSHSIDSDRVFVTGLSAGATMSAALMASYPDQITAGGIHSGVSYGCAFQVGQSFVCMFAPGNVSSETRGDYVREASEDYRGSFPKAFIIHGANDSFVKTSNGDHSVSQWLNVHGLQEGSAQTRPLGSNQSIEEYVKNGEVVVSKLLIRGAGHGWSVDTANGCGSTSQFVINAGVCSAKVLSDAWGLNR